MITLPVFINIVISAVTIIVLLAFSRESLRRIKNILTILTNGAYSDCPFYKDNVTRGRRSYDKSLKSNNKGGDEE